MRFRPSNKTPIGIDIDSRSIAAIQFSGHPGKWRVEAATVLNRAAAGATMDRSEVRRLAEVLDRQGFSGSKVRIAVPDAMQVTGVLELPSMSAGAPVEQVAKLELARMHKLEPDGFEFAYWNLPGRGRAAEGNTLMAVACTTADANTLLDEFEQEGLDVVALDSAAWARARACAPLIDNSKGLVALLDLRWDSAAVALLHQGVIVYQRMLHEFGLAPLHKALMAQLHLEADAADFILSEISAIDDVKLTVDGGPHSRTIANGGPSMGNDDRQSSIVNRQSPLHSQAKLIVAGHVDAMAREIQVSCSYVVRRYADAAPEVLLLMGAGARLPDLEQCLHTALGMNPRIVCLPAILSCPAPLAKVCANTGLITAAGLALSSN